MRHMRHPDVTYLIVNPGLIDHSSKWDAIAELKARDSSRRVIVLPPGCDSSQFVEKARAFGELMVMMSKVDEEFRNGSLWAMMGQLFPDYPPVEIRWCDGYDLYIAGRKAGGGHTAEDAITNAERLISGDLEKQQSWLVG